MKLFKASILGVLFCTNALAKGLDGCVFKCAQLTQITSKIQQHNLPAVLAMIDALPGNLSNVCACLQHGNIALLKFRKAKDNYLLEYNSGVWSKAKIVPMLHESYKVTIKNSFYKDGLAQGLNVGLLSQAEAMFKERVRFNKSLHKNDTIKILVEHKAAGDIVLMATLKQKNKQLTAMRFLSHGRPGFYDANGHALVEGFDRAPIKYRRISSPFRKSRKHPILGYSRPHKGVDLAADSGTPIHATSSGEIVSLGALRGYGRTVIIKHKDSVQTLYAHMHNYAKGLHTGDHVHRKQVIGYVGMTGLATAPHCHYEFRIGHVAHDPMKIKLPVGERLAGARLKRFKTKWQQRYRILQG